MRANAITKLQAVAIIVIVVIAAVAGVYYYYSTLPPAREVGEPIKIGIVTNLTGAYAPENIRARIQWTAWTTEINAKGGIYLSGTGKYHPIELIIYDGESSVARYVELATKMVTEKVVHVIILYGAPPPFTVPAVISIEKVGGIPAIGGSPIDTIAGSALPSVPGGKFVWYWTAGFNYTVYGELWEGFLSQYKAKINKIGVVYTDDTSGRDAYKKIVPRVEAAGFKIFFPGFIPPGTTDLTAIIKKFMEEGVDVVLVNTTPVEWISFRRQCAAMGYQPKMFGVGRCMKIPEAEALGRDLAEGVVAETHWWYTLPFKGNEWYRTEWKKYLGDMSMTHMEGIAYMNFFVALEAVKIAGTLDRNAINNAFAKIDMETPVGRVKFREDHLCETSNTLAQFELAPEGWTMRIVYVRPQLGVKPETPLRTQNFQLG
ncbi:MAG: ABC transporter substrate-binding protein [Candidatus Bathyarchaeia archaeon]